MSSNLLLSPGIFTRQQAEVIISTYCNVTLEDDQGTHFRLVVRHEHVMVWRAWNFEPDAGQMLNHYIARYGIRKP